MTPWLHLEKADGNSKLTEFWMKTWVYTLSLWTVITLAGKRQTKQQCLAETVTSSKSFKIYSESKSRLQTSANIAWQRAACCSSVPRLTKSQCWSFTVTCYSATVKAAWPQGPLPCVASGQRQIFLMQLKLEERRWKPRQRWRRPPPQPQLQPQPTTNNNYQKKTQHLRHT